MSNTEMLTSQLGECAERQDFEGALKLVRENQAEFARVLQPAGVRDALKKTTKDRLLLSFLVVLTVHHQISAKNWQQQF